MYSMSGTRHFIRDFYYGQEYAAGLACPGRVQAVSCIAGGNSFIKKMGIATAAVSVMIFLLPIGIFNKGRIVFTYGLACVAT